MILFLRLALIYQVNFKLYKMQSIYQFGFIKFINDKFNKTKLINKDIMFLRLELHEYNFLYSNNLQILI